MRLYTSATLVLMVASAAAQTGPTFDVVSIKRNLTTTEVRTGSPPPPVNRPDGSVMLTGVTVGALISRAYPTVPGLPIMSTVGLPGWATGERAERYDVRATASLTQATPADRAAMMRAMLADRFKLVAHIEPREEEVYALVLARSDGRPGPGLVSIGTDCDRIVEERRTTPAPVPALSAPMLPCWGFRTTDPLTRSRIGGRRAIEWDLIEGETTMSQLPVALSFPLGRLQIRRRVVDRTGLPGWYRFTLNYDSTALSVQPGAPTPTGPDFLNALQQQLGLKLQPSVAQVDTLIVDRIERPTEN